MYELFQEPEIPDFQNTPIRADVAREEPSSREERKEDIEEREKLALVDLVIR